MSTLNTQTVIIDALAKGKKLYEILREPGMPAKATIDKWCEEPGFQLRFRSACDAGRCARDEQADQSNRPAVLRGRRSRMAPQPLPKPRAVQVAQEPKAVQFMQAAKAPRRSILTTLADMATIIPTSDYERQKAMLASLTDGLSSLATLQLHRVNSTKLASWRKDSGFKVSWDAALAAGKKKMGLPLRGAPAKVGNVAKSGRPRNTVPYFYLSTPLADSLECTITFQRRYDAPSEEGVFFNTSFQVLPSEWDENTRLVLASHPGAAHVNRELLAINELAIEMMNEAKTQDEIRDQLGFPPARVICEHTRRPSALTVPAEEAVLPAIIPTEEPEALIIPFVMPDETTPAPVATPPADVRYCAADVLCNTVDEAAGHAFRISRLTGQPVTIYEVRSTAIGTVSASGAALSQVA